MAIANTLHPDLCSFDLEAERAAFYRRFYGTDPATAGSANRSFFKPSPSAAGTKRRV